MACEICIQRRTVQAHHQIHNHHLIGRTNLRYRHCLENRIRLCSQHHTMGQYRVKQVAHGDLEQVRQFELWLLLHKPEQHAWWMAHKDDKRKPDWTYQEAYDRIVKTVKLAADAAGDTE